MTEMKKRKADHISICLEEDVVPGYRYWDDVRLVHDALPEIGMDDIDTSVDVLGKTLDFPFIVTAITGGFEGARRINENIAKACSDMRVGMGVGSQRAAIEGVDVSSYEVVRNYDIPLVIGNVGAPQLVEQKRRPALTHEDVGRAMDLIHADFMAIHLNFLQEVVQPEGDTNAKGCCEAIRSLASDFPIIVKETGAGISSKTARKLSNIGIEAIDVAGMGGTSFSAIEMHRAEESDDWIKASLGETFFDWGIPAPVSLLTSRSDLPMIASGGVSTGLDVARAMSLGAVCAGGAGAVLKAATESADAVKDVLVLIKEELKAAMLLTGSACVQQLARAERILVGRTREWVVDLQ